MRVTQEGPDVLSRYCPVQAIGLGQADFNLFMPGVQLWRIYEKQKEVSWAG